MVEWGPPCGLRGGGALALPVNSYIVKKGPAVSAKNPSIVMCLLQFLKGSTEQGVVVNNTLTPVIFARYITILPKECTGACALRAEFYGCYEGKLAILKINW